jgi:hypothetical protein
VQNSFGSFLTVTGTDTIAATVSPALTAYASGQMFAFVAANTNTGAVTINISSLGAKAITKTGNTALASGDLTANYLFVIVYDGTQFQVVGVSATTFTNLTVSGVLTLSGAGVQLLSTGTGAWQPPSGTTAQQPGSPSAGAFRWDSTLGQSSLYNGSAWGSVVNTNSVALVTPTMLSQPLTAATAQATTSGTSKDFTGIPSWVKRITVMLNGVSKTGATNFLVQLGTSGGVVSTGYGSLASFSGASSVAGNTTSTAGFNSAGDANTSLVSAIFTIVNVSGNIWVASLAGAVTNSVYGMVGGGNVTLSGVLTRVRLTTISGTDTFSTGSVNILYE